MRKATIALSLGAFLMSVSVVGCSEYSYSGTPPPDAKQGPRPPEMPPGASEAMKDSLHGKLKGSRPARRSGPSQVPH